MWSLIIEMRLTYRTIQAPAIRLGQKLTCSPVAPTASQAGPATLPETLLPEQPVAIGRNGAQKLSR